jgi:hypothetical protein
MLAKQWVSPASQQGAEDSISTTLGEVFGENVCVGFTTTIVISKIAAYVCMSIWSLFCRVIANPMNYTTACHLAWLHRMIEVIISYVNERGGVKERV